jgi:hypothetical protein
MKTIAPSLKLQEIVNALEKLETKLIVVRDCNKNLHAALLSYSNSMESFANSMKSYTDFIRMHT